MFKNQIRDYVLANPRLVAARSSDRYPGLSVLKYKKTVFFNDAWDEYLEHCRGSVVDADFNLVSYPFTKIYNYGIEARAPVFAADTPVTAFRKVNGFMVALSWHNGDVLVSTTGSLDSDYVNMAREMMLTHATWADWQMAMSSDDLQGMTLMFECVHPNDPHIITEKPGMYVLGYRENTWLSTVGHNPEILGNLAEKFNCRVPEHYHTTVGQVQAMVRDCKHEGFVFYTEDGVGAKIKSPYYLTSKWVARNPRTDKLVDLHNDIKKNIDEEYHGLIDRIRENIQAYTAMDEQARLAWVRDNIGLKSA